MVQVDVAPGELIDKITILEIKAARIADPAKLKNIHHELSILTRVRDEDLNSSTELTRLTDEIRRLNEKLWVIEDDIRSCEKNNDFGARFIELARSVYITNDQRAARKKDINTLLHSTIVEEKSYVP